MDQKRLGMASKSLEEENLFDEEYEEVHGYPAQGRGAYGGISYSFKSEFYLSTLGANAVQHDLEALDFETFRGFCWWGVLCRIFEGKKFIAVPAGKVDLVLSIRPFVSGVVARGSQPPQLGLFHSGLVSGGKWWLCPVEEYFLGKFMNFQRSKRTTR